MKSRLQITSIMLLFAMVLSAFPALAIPSPVSAAVCYQAQFVADVTVPDGTTYTSETAFKKTWRLRNIGTCTWNTNDVTMFFESGEQLGAPASVPMPSAVAPGATVDISVDMKAPSAAGRYIGYWKFKSSQGTIFGIGVSANKAWWVEINVPSNNSGSVAYDFAANAEKATWTSGAGGLTFPGTDGDAKGFALRKDKPKFESGVEAAQPGLLVGPQNITNGFIQAEYPAFRVDASDRFQATVGCESGATTCYVAYRLDYKVGGVVKTYWTFRERFEGLTYTANINLAPLAGKDVSFILYVSAYGSPAGDRAIWGNPVILRRGIVPPPVTGTPPTATATRTPGTVTATIPPSACDKVQFIKDVTIPDGTVLQPGTQFKKTWQLKNVGTCAWNKSYQLVYVSGPQMGGPTSAPFPLADNQVVAVGQTVEITIDLTAPSAAGSYRGFWMFKNANGALFGLGAQGNKPWWVDIKVAGPTVTPGGVTATPSATGTPGTPTSTATSASATSAPTGYQNTKYNFKFALPSGATIQSQSDNVGRVNLQFSSGTTLLEKYVQVNVTENANPCVSPVMDGAVGTENVTINNIQFTKQSGQGVAAGNIYDWVAYSTVRNNACISLTFILHSANPGVFTTPPPAFDKNAESAVFTTIMDSFNWINP